MRGCGVVGVVGGPVQPPHSSACRHPTTHNPSTPPTAPISAAPTPASDPASRVASAWARAHRWGGRAPGTRRSGPSARRRCHPTPGEDVVYAM